MLASRFASHSPALRSDYPLSDDQIRRVAPSIFADAPHESRSERYSYMALRPGDTLVVWKLDRLGRDLRHLINTVHDLTGRGIGLKVLTGHGAAIDTTTAAGKLVFGIFAALAEFERELIAERTVAGLASARARGRKGGRPFKMTAAKLRLAMAAMGQSETKVGDLCQELGITRQTLYRHISPKGELRPDGEKLLSRI
ncbi:recombinase family protein [Alicycliphilus denitrificans]|uniref:Resolvase domain protein n=1 Tax=Alicycliphilus denitrificans (strain DSM 14773 / CIP 107495 / K601) TaxID=596154 RepID=F4G778_ALIDK|nr:recombinase family protein [Alicycliphilus denitrificans]AEB84322.1 Resolvase domain protein [Alicycliphilus denitrificans K601]